MQASENSKTSRAARTALRDAILVLALVAIGTTIDVRVDPSPLVGEAVAADPRPAAETTVEGTGRVDHDAACEAADHRRLVPADDDVAASIRVVLAAVQG